MAKEESGATTGLHDHDSLNLAVQKVFNQLTIYVTHTHQLVYEIVMGNS